MILVFGTNSIVHNMLLQIPPETPGALRTLMENNALFALMAVIILVLARFSWTMLNKHLKKLEDDGQTKTILDEILRILKNEK